MLLTRAPLYRGRSPFSLDLHVLGAPLTFVLSQDQTLQLNPVGERIDLRRPAASFFTLIRLLPGLGVWQVDIGDPRYLSRVFVALSFQGPRGMSGSRRGVKPIASPPLCQRIFQSFLHPPPGG